MRKLLPILVLLAAAYLGLSRYGGSIWHDAPDHAAGTPAASSSGSDALLASAFANRLGGLPVEGSGTVAKVLDDDDEGSRHQRFILRLKSGQTLLVAHNIDVAPRIESLREGDTVGFNGEYEWNAKGGVIHWTHHDPGGRHAAGWIRHRGKTYQ